MRKTSSRLMLSVGIFLCFCASVSAQRFKSGLLAGLNTSQITGDNLAGYNKPGLNAGIWLNTSWKEKWTLWMAMEYLPKGSKKNISAKDSIPTYYRLQLHYIEVPVMVSYQLMNKLSLETGISTGVFISSREEDEFGDMSGAYSPREQFSRYDISFAAGLFWHINSKWKFNLRSLNSIFPVRKHDQQTSLRLNQGQYSSCVMGRLFYTF